jgi:hypothetical protein
VQVLSREKWKVPVIDATSMHWEVDHGVDDYRRKETNKAEPSCSVCNL